MSSDPPDVEKTEEEPSFPEARAGYGTRGVRAYLEKYHGRFTDEALTDSLVKAGYPADAVRDGFNYVAEREASAPVRGRARRIVIALYVLGYVALVVGMFANTGYLAGVVALYGSAILTFVLGIAFVIALDWVGRRRVEISNLSGALPVLVSVPVVLWLVVTGVCIATGAPVQWVGSSGP